MKRLATPLLVLVLAGCGADKAGEPGSAASPPTVAQRWDALTEEQRQAVCTEMASTPEPGTTGTGQLPESGPDYRGMLQVLMGTGLKQGDASAMLPYAANECT